MNPLRRRFLLALTTIETLDRISPRGMSEDELKVHLRRQWGVEDLYHELSVKLTSGLVSSATDQRSAA